MANATHNDTFPASEQVERTAIFYTLLPLAMSTMTQPVGSVLGTNPISKTYLRSSPIICAIDILVFLLEIRLLRSRFCHSLKDAVILAFELRYEKADDTEGLHDMRNGTILRWVFFVLGTHGCILKLAAGEGIPWSKAWGFTYVASFAVFEVLIWLVPKTEVDSLRSRRPRLWRGTHADESDWPLIVAFFSCLVVWMLGGGEVCRGLSDILSEKHTTAGTTGAFLLLLPWPQVVTIIILVLAYSTTTMARTMRQLVAKHPGVGERFLVLTKKHADAIRSIDVVSGMAREPNMAWMDGLIELHLWPLLAFIMNFTTALLWYMIVYDPSTTKRATWTDVFG